MWSTGSTVIKRRAEFDLEKAKARAHILEGYLIALKNLDEIINLIRSARTWKLPAKN
jgi:DNA gyrase subunit A